jgi:hypothetical protein
MRRSERAKRSGASSHRRWRRRARGDLHRIAGPCATTSCCQRACCCSSS